LLVAFALLFLLNLTASAQSPAPSPSSFVRAHRQVSTDIPAAQDAFDDGLTLLYAYNPGEARRSFRRAADADSKLAMAWWGVAMSYGPNINTDYDPGNAKNGHDAILRAQALATHASAVERALIDAAAKRFALFGDGDGDASGHAYRDAMVAVAERFPLDDDVQTLTAEAGMDVRPWAYYNDDGTAAPGTQDIVNRLQLVLARDPGHIGAEHFLIHAVEESPHPELALEAAKRLAADTFEPGAEHLIHMPAHTFERVGMYHEAGEANARAADAFAAYRSSEAKSEHAGYLGHDCLFGVDAFMTAGEYARASTLAQACAKQGAGKGLARIVDWRFGDWTTLTKDNDGGFVSSMVAVHDRDFATALKNSKALAAQDSTTAKIASDFVAAAVARARGEQNRELTLLAHAVSLQDNAGYQEPPAFYFSAREALGAAQLRASRPREAAQTFRTDLEKNADNPRSLFGLATALGRLGDAEGASDALKRFDVAWSHADTPLTIENL
jgi:tetratricopeptide (TPR) repeat protein